MRRFPIILISVIAVLATACGTEGSETRVGDDADPPSASSSTTTTTTLPDGDGEPLGAGPYPIADITITVFTDGSDVATGQTYRLACLGDTATLTGDPAPNTAAAMCLELNDPDVRTRLIGELREELACTMQFGGPELAVVTGTLDGEAVDTTVDRTNGCGIAEWSGLLGGLLPAADS